MAICLFEDQHYGNLLPLAHLNPDFDLRCGIFTARERCSRMWPDKKIVLQVRPVLADVMRERTGLPVNESVENVSLFLNGRALLNSGFPGIVPFDAPADRIIVSHGHIIACQTATKAFRSKAAEHLSRGETGPDSLDELSAYAEVLESDSPLIEYPWDLIGLNPSMIRSDADLLQPGLVHPASTVADSSEIVSPENVLIGAGARIGPGAVLDASRGPVIVDDNAVVMAQAVLQGPVYIGEGSTVKIGAKIYEGTSVGPVCKIGGEVEECIYHSFANKQHDGYTGHSYFASWTNLGADTNTSDLKNNYSFIRMPIGGKEYSTGSRFLGTIMAEHSKCSINTMFNTGTSIGVGCNIFGGGFPPRDMPDFSWGGADGVKEYNLEHFLKVAGIVLNRRDRTLTDAEQDLLRYVFSSTTPLRNIK